MAYKYKTYGNNSAGDPSANANYGYVNYNITPDFGTVLCPGDTVRIEGEVCSKLYAIGQLCFTIPVRRVDAYSVTGLDFYVDVSAAKGKVAKFSKSFRLNSSEVEGFGEAFTWTGARVIEGCDNCHFWADEVSGGFLTGNGQGFGAATAQKARLGKYRLSPQILAMGFGRATAGGAWADEGQYLQCRTLKIAKNSQASVGDFTKATLVCAGSDGSSKSVNLNQTQLNAALTANGYSETKPGLFAGFASSLGVTYTLTLTLGDGYEQASSSCTVMRVFARLHLSGAKNGGVAVGMFSSATDAKPKFEVADTHESHFYGPVFFDGYPTAPFIPLKIFVVNTGSTSVAANGTYEGSVSFEAVPGADGYAVLGYVGGYSYNSSGDIPTISGTTLNYKLHNITSSKHTLRGYYAVMAYKTLGTAKASDPALPDGPDIFDSPDEISEEPCADPGVARADYVAMMVGIEIPADAEAAGDIQADAGGIEVPGIEGEPTHSAKFDTVKLYRDAGVWSDQMVRNAVGKWITGAEAEKILTAQEQGSEGQPTQKESE